MYSHSLLHAFSLLKIFCLVWTKELPGNGVHKHDTHSQTVNAFNRCLCHFHLPAIRHHTDFGKGAGRLKKIYVQSSCAGHLCAFSHPPLLGCVEKSLGAALHV